MEICEKAKLFKALGDEKRLQILELLYDGEKCACSLFESMNMPQSSLSYHMKILCCSGLVSAREQGKWIYYHIEEEGCREAIRHLKYLSGVKKV